MGFVTGSIRLLYLHQLRNDLEHKMMLVAEAKADMVRNADELMSIGTDLDSDSPVVKNLKARRDKIKVIEAELDKKMKMYEIRLRAVDAEIRSAQSIVENGIRTSFTYGVGH